MAISINTEFKVNTALPIDNRIVLTKEQMKSVDDDTQPDVYFALCKDDGNMYLYNKNNTASETTGKFKKFEGGGGSTDDCVKKYDTTTMVALGFEANSDVDVAAFLEKIRITYGECCVVKFKWEDATAAYITDGTNKTNLISGYTLYSGMNILDTSGGTWKNSGALLVGSSNFNSVYNLTATISTTEGVISNKSVSQFNLNSTNPQIIGGKAQIGYGKPTQIGNVPQIVFEEEGVFISQGGNENAGIHCDGSRMNIWGPGDNDFIHVYDTDDDTTDPIAYLDDSGAWNKAKCDEAGNNIIQNYPRAYDFGTISLTQLKTYTNTYPPFIGSCSVSDGPGGSMWYNVQWIPHRNGGGSGDNSSYGQLLMYPMTTVSSTFYRYEKSANTWYGPYSYQAMQISVNTTNNTATITY